MWTGKLIIGLGNPGDQYSKTRHNIGFDILKAFAKRYSFDEFKSEKKFFSLVTAQDLQLNYSKRSRVLIQQMPTNLNADQEQKGFFTPPTIEKKISLDNYTKQIKTMLIMPQTFMNDSGKAVSEIVNFYKIDYSNILVVHDDVSLALGKIKFTYKHGAGGQHGVEDIMTKLGNRKDFHRLKVGVGPDPGGDERANYVLSNFPKEEQEQVEKIIDDSVIMISKWLCDEETDRIEMS